jgi:hypothetical protein
MTHNLKALGIALVAVVAMTALGASAAQAAPAFTWANITQELTTEVDGAGSGTGKQTLTTTSGSFICQGASDRAAATGTKASEITLQHIRTLPARAHLGDKRESVLANATTCLQPGKQSASAKPNSQEPSTSSALTAVKSQ